MFALSPSIKCFVKVIASVHYKKEVNTLADYTVLLNICIVKVIDIEESSRESNEILNYAIYVPEESHIKPLINDQLWVSSRSLIKYVEIGDDEIGIVDAANDLLKIIIWYLSWNPMLGLTNSLSDSPSVSPFPICVISPNLLLGYILSYPYLLSKIPVTVILCSENDTVVSGIEKHFLSLVNIIRFSDKISTTTELIDYTLNLGFSQIIIGPATEISEDTLLHIALGCISINGNIVVFNQIEQLSNVECSVLFQKRCTLSFSNQNPDPVNWISNFINNYLADNKSHISDLRISKISTVSDDVIKIENQIAYVLISRISLK